MLCVIGALRDDYKNIFFYCDRAQRAGVVNIQAMDCGVALLVVLALVLVYVGRGEAFGSVDGRLWNIQGRAVMMPAPGRAVTRVDLPGFYQPAYARFDRPNNLEHISRTYDDYDYSFYTYFDGKSCAPNFCPDRIFGFMRRGDQFYADELTTDQRGRLVLVGPAGIGREVNVRQLIMQAVRSGGSVFLLGDQSLDDAMKTQVRPVKHPRRSK